MYSKKKKEIWDVEVNPYIITLICVASLLLIWSYHPFDLVINFHSSLVSIAIILFVLYSVGYETVRSLTMLATMLILFVFSVTILRHAGDLLWRGLVWILAT